MEVFFEKKFMTDKLKIFMWLCVSFSILKFDVMTE